MQWSPPKKKQAAAKRAAHSRQTEMSQGDLEALRKFAEAIRAALPILT